jgi:hypothetical protein
MTEVIGNGGERLAEMLLPEAIRHRAQEDRVVFAGDPFRERGAVSIRRCFAEKAWERRLNGGTRPFEVATHEDGACRHAFGEDAHGRAERFAFFGQHGVVEECPQAIKVGLADGIIRMIVALRATDGEAESHGADGGGDVVEQDMTALVLFVEVRHVRAGKEESRGRFIAHQIPSDLLLHENIEGHVVIERVDDPVAILPGAVALGIVFETVCFREACEIKPPLRPVFAVARTGEQFVRDGLER